MGGCEQAAEAKCEAAVKNNTADLMEELGELISTELCKDTGLCKKSSALVGGSPPQNLPSPPPPIPTTLFAIAKR